MEKTLEGYALPVSALAAALVCAGEQDVRYYLNGVFLDFPRGRIVATDGHRLFCGAIPVADCQPVIVPREFAESAIRVWRKLKKIEREEFPAFIVSVTGQAQRCVSFSIATRAMLNAQEIDGRFPEYERVIPAEGGESVGQVGQFDLQYLADAGRALALYDDASATVNDKAARYCHVEHNGPNGCGVITRKDSTAFVVVMGIRSAGEGASREWYTGKPATVPA